MQALSFKELEHLKTLDERCDKCGHQLVEIITLDIEPFCQNCQRRMTEEKNEQRVKAMEDYVKRQKTYGWLKQRSLILDRQLKRARFTNFDVQTRAEQNLKQKAQRIANDYIDGQVFNTILTGTPGAGKSHLAMAILAHINENSDPYKRCLYIAIQDMMRKIRASFDNSESRYTEQYCIDLCQEADVLVLDDLGAETGAIQAQRAASDFTNRVLNAVIDSRQDKPTIVTTNLNSEQLSKMYDQKLLSRMYKGIKANDSVLVFNNVSDKRSGLKF